MTKANTKPITVPLGQDNTPQSPASKIVFGIGTRHCPPMPFAGSRFVTQVQATNIRAEHDKRDAGKVSGEGGAIYGY
jgi:hypothetical protein